MAYQSKRDNPKSSVRLICEAFQVAKSQYYYRPVLSEENTLICQWLVQITEANKRWGFGLCFLYLRNVMDFTWNHKRVYRLYKELELNMRIKPRKRLTREVPDRLSVPQAPNEVLSMDFMHDGECSSGKLKSFNVIDDYNREALCVHVDTKLGSAEVIEQLGYLIETRGAPKEIRCDNGPEYISRAFTEWAHKQGIKVRYIQPGKPTQNAYIERFNRTCREELLNMHCFQSKEQAQLYATQWMYKYNHQRPHTALGGWPPKMYAPQASSSTSNPS